MFARERSSPDVEATPRPRGDRGRLRLRILGAVQGVGFRPFVYRLATELELGGWVRNSTSGVLIEVEGPRDRLDAFLARVEREAPPRARIQSVEPVFLDPAGLEGFAVLESVEVGPPTALVLPDVATCADCLKEIFDPSDRRHLYPFTNCTNCGPRYSIVLGLPYDRERTTMRRFRMCPDCAREYDDPADRRFHAQPNACPACGPKLELWDARGRRSAESHDALLEAAERIRKGEIVAVKGLGGFHLACDAADDEAVRRLRARKRREEKPFALLFPSLEAVRERCRVSALEERLLLSPEAPIVLLEARDRAALPPAAAPPRSRARPIAPSVAPGNPYLGVMLPYTPLHHILLRELGFPIVATSGNASEEPIATDEREALERLAGIADAYLVHDRPIARHVDDSIARIAAGREIVLRRARGYAPLPCRTPRPLETTIAVGAHLKNAVALSVGEQVFVSQHVGDLETPQALEAFREVVESLKSLYGAEPSLVACDLHPDYASTVYARSLGLPLASVQHHHAHVAACMAENELEGRVLGVSWDGTGLGADGTVWGGEFLLATLDSFERFAHLRTFRLPGGDAAAREPRRAALGILYEIFGDGALERGGAPTLDAFAPRELGLLLRALRSGLNSPVTSSAGRLFDAVASILGLRQRARYEAQAAMELEFACLGAGRAKRYELPLEQPSGGGPLVVDWEGAVRGMLRDPAPLGEAARGFHEALARAIVAVAERAGEERVVLTGGCFQNKVLSEEAVRRLREAGFRPYWHQRIPPNDGGIALGQAVAAAGNRGARP